jgi:neurotransmitter:Na+ symporter, NSS family
MPPTSTIDSDIAGRGHWTTRWGFVLAATGSAIGLGNIWKFPYMTGENGGGAFVIVYLACIVVVGLPVLMAEILLGRRAQRNPATSMELLAREARATPRWRYVGLVGIVAGALILSFYSVVAGWMLAYLVRAAGGAFTGIDGSGAAAAFETLLADPLRLVLWHSVFMLLSVWIVARGVARGLEVANKVLMPALAAILILLLGYGVIHGDMARSIAFMFAPDFSKITPGVVLAAMGQAFFTLSIGMGAMMAYGSYLERNVSIARTAAYVAAADTLFAIIAGLAIFSIVFASGLPAAAGPGLIMQTLPIAFGHMVGGHLIGTLFFLLIVMAAWTSAISILEPAVSWVAEQTRLHRTGACVAVGLTAWVLGIAVALSFNVWQSFTLFGRGFFDFLDFLTANIMLPIGGLLIALFAAWVVSSDHARQELGCGARVFALWRYSVRYVAPLVILLIFLNLTGVLPTPG